MKHLLLKAILNIVIEKQKEDLFFKRTPLIFSKKLKNLRLIPSEDLIFLENFLENSMIFS